MGRKGKDSGRSGVESGFQHRADNLDAEAEGNLHVRN